jgi:hypothetical protein
MRGARQEHLENLKIESGNHCAQLKVGKDLRDEDIAARIQQLGTRTPTQSCSLCLVERSRKIKRNEIECTKNQYGELIRVEAVPLPSRCGIAGFVCIGYAGGRLEAHEVVLGDSRPR